MGKILITEPDVLDQLRNLNVNKNPDPDGITPKIIKLTSSAICKPLVKLFDKSLELKFMPNIWKQANSYTGLQKKIFLPLSNFCFVLNKTL